MNATTMRKLSELKHRIIDVEIRTGNLPAYNCSFKSLCTRKKIAIDGELVDEIIARCNEIIDNVTHELLELFKLLECLKPVYQTIATLESEENQ